MHTGLEAPVVTRTVHVRFAQFEAVPAGSQGMNPEHSRSAMIAVDSASQRARPPPHPRRRVPTLSNPFALHSRTTTNAHTYRPAHMMLHALHPL